MRIVPYIVLLIIFQSCASQEKPSLIDAEMETNVKEKLSYYLYYPEDYEDEPDKEFPILLFLHGGGESGDSLVTVKRKWSSKIDSSRKKVPIFDFGATEPQRQEMVEYKGC